MQQLHKKYGYKLYNCTMEEWKHNFFDNMNPGFLQWDFWQSV